MGAAKEADLNVLFNRIDKNMGLSGAFLQADDTEGRDPAEEGKGIFTIKARRCKRCGRLLTSPQAVDIGYGCQCAAKTRAEKLEREQLPGQMSILDYFKQEDKE